MCQWGTQTHYSTYPMMERHSAHDTQSGLTHSQWVRWGVRLELGAVMVRKIIITSLFLFPGFVLAYDVRVNPYARKDGTLVQGHYRTAPNINLDDNYGTRGNLNPYTNVLGTQPRNVDTNIYRINVDPPIMKKNSYDINFDY